MEFSSLVWTVPILLLTAVIIAFTLNHSKKTTKLSVSSAIISFILSLCVLIERYLTNEQDYGYYFDWFVLDNYYYRMGYELNHTSAFFLVLVTGLNVVLHLVNRINSSSSSLSAYGYLNLIFGLVTGIIMSDNILTYYILSFCISVALFIQLAYVNEHVQAHTLRKSSKSFIVGHLLFLCALLLIFYHQPSHAVEFTVIDSSLSMQPDLLNFDQEWIIGLLLVLSTIFISTLFVPFGKQFITHSSHHVISLYILMGIRLILPTYMMIRFESLIRIDDYIEVVVLIIGVMLLLSTCRQLFKICDTADILLHLSNAMLGMLYIMYGLQAKLMLSALVLIFVLVIILSVFLIQLKRHRWGSRIVKLVIAMLLLLPFIISISTGKLQGIEENTLENIYSIVVWLSMIIYSFIVFISLFKFRNIEMTENYRGIRKNVITFLIIFIVALCMASTAILSWLNVMPAISYEYSDFLNVKIELSVVIIYTQVIIGFIIAYALYRKQNKKNDSIYDNGAISLKQSWNIFSRLKIAVIYIVDKMELFWDSIWETILPFIFKRGEVYISIKQPHFVTRLVSIWIFAAVLSILLIIIRG